MKRLILLTLSLLALGPTVHAQNDYASKNAYTPPMQTGDLFQIQRGVEYLRMTWANMVTEMQAALDVETSAELDVRDGNNRVRSNHTGTQTLSTLSDFPAGGTTGQVLGKASNANYDVEWISGGGGSGTWIGLTDTPGSYAGRANELVTVNGTGDGITTTDTINTLTTNTLTVTGSMSGDGNGLTNLATVLTKPLHVESTTDSEDLTLFYTTVAITLTEVRAVHFGTTPSVTFALKFDPDRNAAGTDAVASVASTSTTTGDVATLADATIPAGNWVWFETSATAGTVDASSFNVSYTQD